MDSGCWSDGFNFEACCVQRVGGCWDGQYTAERCCGAAGQRISRGLGDPSCWRSGAAKGFSSYEQCCVGNDTLCWGPAADGSGTFYTFERCCGDAAALGDRAHDCDVPLAEPLLSLWGNDDSQGQLRAYQDWDFGRLVTLTGLVFFTLPYLPANEVGQFEGRFLTAADGGMSMARSSTAAEFIIQSLGGKGVYMRQSLSRATSYRFRLQLQSWTGVPSLLYAVPHGCNASSTPPEVALLYCRPTTVAANADDLFGSIRLLADMYGWSISTTLAADASTCFLRLDEAVRELDAQGRLGTLATVVLSPYLARWNPQQHGLRLKAAIDMFAEYDADELAVIGFPCAGLDGRWRWPLRRVRRQYWKLQYTEYPSGSARRLLGSGQGAAICHGGDAVSATRVYRTGVLSALLPHVDAVANAAWLVNLDLEALRQGYHRRTFLCAKLVLAEEDHLKHVDLGPLLASRYQIEAAMFHPERGLRVNCAISASSEGRTSADTAYELVVGQGLVAPWCFRRSLRESFRKLATWWQGLSPSNFVVASDGTGLALLRNGREPIPWDLDVDVQLFTESDSVVYAADFKHWNESASGATDGSVRSSAHRALANLSAAGFEWDSVLDYSARGAGVHIALRYVDRSESSILPVVVEADAVMRAHMSPGGFPLIARFAGIGVRMGSDLQDLLANKYRSADKLTKLRDGSALACANNGHNACLPNCTAGQADCEFPDRFVEIDYFE